MQEYFEIGQIVNTFGVKGFVKVKPFTDDLERFEELESILVIKNEDMIDKLTNILSRDNGDNNEAIRADI